MEPYVWLIIMAAFLVMEALTAGLTTIWFAGGSLAAFLLSAAGVPLIWQIAAFVAVSLILLIFTRPVAVRYINNRAAKTNVVDRIIGRNAIVTEEINNVKATGKVAVDGMPWSARTAEDTDVIPVGTEVVVDALQGVKCIVHEEKHS